MSETTEKGADGTFKLGISLWLAFCLVICLWFLSRFMRGRRQLRSNLHIIEDGLRRMQEEIEREEREQGEKSLGCGDNLEDLIAELQKTENTTEELKEKGAAAPLGTDDVEVGTENESTQDKKND